MKSKSFKKKFHPPFETYAENYYYLKQMKKKTPIAVENIGLYELGRFAWENEQYLEALKHWKNIENSYSTKSLQDIRRVISQNLELNQTVLDINSSLNWYSETEQRAFIARLTQYGKWQNRYKKD